MILGCFQGPVSISVDSTDVHLRITEKEGEREREVPSAAKAVVSGSEHPVHTSHACTPLDGNEKKHDLKRKRRSENTISSNLTSYCHTGS